MSDSLLYQLIRSKPHQHIYQNAMESLYTICIPPDAHLQECIQNQPQLFITDVLKSHILKPSQFFLGEYISDTNKTFQEEDGMLISKDDPTFKARIVKDETLYNNDFKPYKVWYLEHLLLENFDKFLIEVTPVEKQKLPPPPKLANIEEMKAFLQENAPDLVEKCQTFVQDFNDSYLLLKGYLAEAIQKINSFYRELLDDVHFLDPKFKDSAWSSLIKICIHSVLLQGVHKKLFAFYTYLYQNDDVNMNLSRGKLEFMSMSDFGIPKAFQKNQDRAIQLLSTLNQIQDLYSKMICLKHSMDVIVEDLDKSEHNMFQEKEKKHVTSDELLPIVSYCLIQGNGEKLISNLCFMTDFQIPEMSSSEIGYALVTFEAAIESIKRECEKLEPKRLEDELKDKMNLEESPIPSPEGKLQQVESKEKDLLGIGLSRSIRLNNPKDSSKSSSFLLDLMKSDDEISDPDSD